MRARPVFCSLLLALPTKRAFIFGMLAFLLAATIGDAQCILPAPGLVSWWPGEGTAADAVGGNPGMLSSSGVAFAPGVVGLAFRFDGSNGFVQLPDDLFPIPLSGYPAGTSPFSVELWFRTTASGVILGQQTMLPMEPRGNNDGWIPAIYVGTNGQLYVHAFHSSPGMQPIISPRVVNDGFFHHVAATFDGSVRTVYLDGARLGTNQFRQQPYNNATVYHYQLGNGYTRNWPSAPNGWAPFQGIIDEPAVYNRALTAAEVAAIRQVGSAGRCPPPSPSEVIYQNDFERVDTEGDWAPIGLDRTPQGGRRFLGQFGNSTVTLTLTNLPVHSNLTVAFDLLILNSWDGSMPRSVAPAGPDLFEASVEGGPTLLYASFDNASVSLGRPQSFPATYRTNDYPGQTGALEVNTLGFPLGDAVYRLRYTFLHSTNRLRLLFRGSGLQPTDDESWGLDNIVIYPGGPTVTLRGVDNHGALETPTNVVLTAEVTPGQAPIRYVQFLANHAVLGIVTNSPYTLIWSNQPAGVNVLAAQAVDQAGRVSEAIATVTVNGVLGQYFNNTTLSGAPRVRRDPSVRFAWDRGSPIVGINANSFSARWLGELVPRIADTYTFSVAGDGRVRLWVNGQRLIDTWSASSPSLPSASLALEPGQPNSIQLDYFDTTGNSAVRLQWETSDQPVEVIPPSQLRPPISAANRPPNLPFVQWPARDGYAVEATTNLLLLVDLFSDPDLNQHQTAVEWEIYESVVTPTRRIWFHSDTNGANFLTNWLSNGTFTGTYVGLTRLLINEDYILRVRHRDSATAPLWSEWSERFFNTRPPGVGAPSITPVLPTNVFVVGDTLVLSVSPTNLLPTVPDSLQWRFNGEVIPGATNSILTLRGVQVPHSGEYSVFLRNPAGTLVSPSLRLTVQYQQICGRIWEDRNGNGFPDASLIRGSRPDIIFVVDKSTSTTTIFGGEPVGDINGDGPSNTRLDAELAAFISLNKALMAHSAELSPRIAIVSFNSAGFALDLNPALPGLQLAAAPGADADADSVSDVEEALRGIRNDGNGTDFHAALSMAVQLFAQLGTTTNGNLIFLSDGECDLNCASYPSDVQQLRGAGILLRAFGAGSDSSLNTLRAIDPDAQQFNRPEQLVEFFGGPTGSLLESERGLPGVTVYLDRNNNGQFDAGEPSTVTSDGNGSEPPGSGAGRYCFDGVRFGTNIVRVVAPGYAETFAGGAGVTGHVLSGLHIPSISDFNIGLDWQATLTLLSISPGGVSLVLTRPSGINHRIEVSSDLLEWAPLTNVSGTNWVMPFADPAVQTQRFYRAVQR
jgi:hypothetical protein